MAGTHLPSLWTAARHRVPLKSLLLFVIAAQPLAAHFSHQEAGRLGNLFVPPARRRHHPAFEDQTGFADCPAGERTAVLLGLRLLYQCWQVAMMLRGKEFHGLDTGWGITFVPGA